MQRVIVLEDEPLIAELLADWLAELGYEVVGPAPSVREALELIDRSKLDAAIVDARLSDGNSLPAAELLRSKSIPFVLASGQAAREQEPGFGDAPRLSKPFDFDQLRSVLERLLGTEPHAL